MMTGVGRKVKNNQLGEEQIRKRIDIKVDLNETYDFIYDLDQIKQFSEKVLKPLDSDGIYLLALMTRNKYINEENPQISMSRKEGNRMFERSILRSNHYSSLVKAVAKFTANYGAYYDRNGEPMPQNGFVTYIMPNPRSTAKAVTKFKKDYDQNLYDCVANPENLYKMRNIERHLISACQESRQGKNYLDLDFDFTSKLGGMHFVEKITGSFGKEHTHCIETRGGFHLLLDLKTTTKEHRKFIWRDVQGFNKMLKNAGTESKIEIKSDDFCPLPGTLQGGFEVKLLW